MSMTESMKQFVCKYQKWIYRAAMGAVILGFLVTRLWKLDRLPAGLHIDEAGMAYDAWCLANFGVDRWLKAWPVYLDNYGAGQSSLYAFLCAGLFKVFGFSVWAVRTPIVLFSALNFIFGYKLAKRIFRDDRWMVFLVSALITFCPYMIMQSRFGLDCDLMLGASTVFLYFFTTAIEEGKLWRYIASGVTGGILLYTYALSYIILPLFLLISLIYVIAAKKFSLPKWFCMAVPMFVIALPLILTQIINLFELREFMLGPVTIPRIKYYRASSIGHFTWEFFFLALKSVFIGDDSLHSAIPGVRNLYAVTIPLFVVGFIGAIAAVKRRDIPGTKAIVYPLFWFIAELFFESHMKPCTYTMNAAFYAVIVLAVYGLWCVTKRMPGIRPEIMAGVMIVYLLCSVRFTGFYFLKYHQATFPLPYFGCMTKEAFEIIEGNETLRRKLTFDSEFGIYYALCMEIPPYEYEIIGDDHVQWRGYWFGSLQEISDDCNYIVCGHYEEYCQELRDAGFTEVVFDNYALYYKE